MVKVKSKIHFVFVSFVLFFVLLTPAKAAGGREEEIKRGILYPFPLFFENLVVLV